ncbi:hypothetical protein E05_25790 [Plautia stali symbiont]|nr:hypothetical protein E05_25790 [Plautia stali symbiont]
MLLAFMVFFSLASDQFLTVQNLLDLAESYAVTGIFALGLFVVLVTGGIDISFAAVASVVQYLIASLFVQFQFDNALLSILLAIVCGTLMGVFLIAILKNGLNLIGVSNYFMNIVVGGTIMVAIAVTHYKKRKETDVSFV